MKTTIEKIMDKYYKITEGGTQSGIWWWINVLDTVTNREEELKGILNNKNLWDKLKNEYKK